jgi:hypothetical protein
MENNMNERCRDGTGSPSPRVVAALAGAALLALVSLRGALAAITTDKADYVPGSPVTIVGDGYTSQEKIDIVVNAPYGTVAGTSTADAGGFFRWSFRLASVNAEGSYTYTATGRLSGLSQSGSFTDDGADSPLACKGGPTINIDEDTNSGSVDIPGDYTGGEVSIVSASGTEIVAMAESGFVISEICIKSGNNTFGTQAHSALTRIIHALKGRCVASVD